MTPKKPTANNRIKSVWSTTSTTKYLFDEDEEDFGQSDRCNTCHRMPSKLSMPQSKSKPPATTQQSTVV